MQSTLVSIIVTTYNSANYIIETLESIKAQTWKNIELIITDDCSTDKPIQLCSNWLEENNTLFERTEIISVPQNTGVAANCNRGIKASNADWIKFIAGDDILLPNCIDDNMRFVTDNNNVAIVFSQVNLYQDLFMQNNFVTAIPEHFPMNIMNPEFSASDQYKLLLLSDRITFTPSSFFNKKALTKVNGFDESLKFVEDYPMWLKLTRAGNKLYFFEKPTVGYRKHEAASNNMANYGLFKPLYLKSGPFLKKNVYPFLPWDIAADMKYVLGVSNIFQNAGMNKKTSFFEMLYKSVTVYFNPFRFIIYLKKKILGLGRTNLFYAD